MKKRQKHYLSVIIILFLCIGIGYAYLSSTLNSSFSNITVTGFDRICQRATTLHTETCTLSSGGCYADGYSASGSKKTKTITYGKLGTTGALSVGDAFDCDVNNDGVYDSATERFYYIGNLSTNSSRAVLIYYNNTNSNGDAAANQTATYNTGNNIKSGPTVAKNYMPRTTKWTKVTLNSTTRTIKDESGTTVVSSFSYSGFAARLLTIQEIKTACGSSITTNGVLDSKCTFMLENTNYHASTNFLTGYWLENQENSSPYYAYRIMATSRRLGYLPTSSVTTGNELGVRPVIEVLKSKMIY